MYLQLSQQLFSLSEVAFEGFNQSQIFVARLSIQVPLVQRAQPTTRLYVFILIFDFAKIPGLKQENHQNYVLTNFIWDKSDYKRLSHYD